jgi:uncharacterized protein (DUF1778 family)
MNLEPPALRTAKKPRALKRERVETRLTPQQKTLVQRAAAIEGRSVSDFIVASATHRAEEVIRAQHVLRLTAEDSLFFAQMVLNPGPPNETLRAAARRHDEVIGP